MKRYTAAFAAVCAAAIYADECAPGPSLAPLIAGRQANYRDLGGAYKAIGDELKKSQPHLTVVSQYADQLNRIARQQSEQNWFPPGTGAEAKVKTAARREIWSQPNEFQKWRKALATEADKLLLLTMRAASTVDIQSQHAALGRTCTGCHKRFRHDDE